MQLSSLLSLVGESCARVRSCAHDPAITNVVDDSRQVTAGSLFVAKAGTKSDGSAFIGQAVSRGASAVLVQCGSHVDPMILGDAVLVEAPEVPLALACLVEASLGSPAGRLQLVGITGTNGKTTTATLYRHLSNAAGRRCGLMGTVEVDDGVERRAAELTTPGSVTLSNCLSRMVANGCQAAVMEVSSHALAQGRVAALDFACAVFTNLSGDHLDYHGSMEAYAGAKALLFSSLPRDGLAVVNAMDPAVELLLHGCRARRLLCTQQITDAPRREGDSEEECSVEIVEASLGSMRCCFRGPWGELDAILPLVGKHNAMNTLQAVAAAHGTGVSATQLDRGLSECGAPPGRLQPVTRPSDPLCVLVDYAHTDDALRNVLEALRPSVPAGGKLTVVFGCGGDRDRTKRPRMAKVACSLADAVWVTSDNPRTEDPLAIVEEILSGVSGHASPKVRVEADRARAIAAAVGSASAGDVVLIAGKGHEDYQIIGTQKFPFDDRVHAADALRSRTDWAST